MKIGKVSVKKKDSGSYLPGSAATYYRGGGSSSGAGGGAISCNLWGNAFTGNDVNGPIDAQGSISASEDISAGRRVLLPYPDPSSEQRDLAELLAEIEKAGSAIPTITMDQMRDMGTYAAAYSRAAVSPGNRFRVVDGTYVVGVLDIISDNMGHLLTQIFTTHYILEMGAFGGTHSDSQVFTYYRSYGIRAGDGSVPVGTWTDWELLSATGGSDLPDDFTLITEGEIDALFADTPPEAFYITDRDIDSMFHGIEEPQLITEEDIDALFK